MSHTPQYYAEKIKDRAFQIEVHKWIEAKLRKIDTDDQQYLEVVKASTPGFRGLTPKLAKLIDHRVLPFILLGTPAHELGHHIFDMLCTLAIMANDPLLAQMYPNETVAVLVAGPTHDGATGIQHRYIDNLHECNHGEMWAYIIYRLLADLLPEPIRLLIAYHCAVHPKILKEVKTDIGYMRQPWIGEQFFNNGRPVRVTIPVQGSDRLENGAELARHAVRHGLATSDAAPIKKASDVHAELGRYSFALALQYTFTPQVVKIKVMDGDKEVIVPSMLDHLQSYQKSAQQALGINPYNKNDHLFSSFSRLMAWKIAASQEGIHKITTTTGIPNFSLYKKLMIMGSGYPNQPRSTEVIRQVEQLWNTYPAEEQAHWAQGFEFAWKSYFEWLDILTSEIISAKNPSVRAFLPLVPGIINRITRY